MRKKDTAELLAVGPKEMNNRSLGNCSRQEHIAKDEAREEETSGEV